jgi:hypothetical protein
MGRQRLRRFVFLDGDLTNDFLSQLEGGTYEQESLTQAGGQRSARGGALGFGPVRAGVTRDGSHETVSARTMQQTPDAAFSRLARLLEEADDVQFLEAFDQAIWRDLQQGEVVEMRCSLGVPSVIRLGQLLQSVPMAEVAAALDTEVDAETQESIEGLGAMLGMLKALPVIGEASGPFRAKLIAPVNPDFLRVGVDDLIDEATIFGTIERKLKPRQKWSLLDAIGMGGLPRDARREAEQGLGQNKELRDFVVTGPAAVVAPIAIFR